MDNRKIILLSYTLGSMLVWFMTRSMVQYLYLSFYQVRRLPGIGMAREALPVILGLIAFGILIRNTRVNQTLDEVVSELKKVTWPSRQDVVRSTTVVIFCIVVASVILMLFDVLWAKLVNVFLKA